MKRILTTLSQKWPEYLLEILVITAGIYGAFALENWNQSNVEIKKRNTVIKTLSTEFEHNLKLMEITMDAHQKTIDASNEWLKIGSTKEVISQQKGDSLIKGIHQSYTFDPLNGALRTAISSGDIHLLKGDSLLQYLFSWEDLVKDAVEDELKSSNQAVSSFNRYYPNLSWPNIFYGHLYKGIPPSNHAALLADPELNQFVTIRTAIISGAMAELNYLKEVNQKIITQLHNLEK